MSHIGNRTKKFEKRHTHAIGKGCDFSKGDISRTFPERFSFHRLTGEGADFRIENPTEFRVGQTVVLFELPYGFPEELKVDAVVGIFHY